MRQIHVPCSCGGGASVNLEAGQTTAATECACGKVLLWSEESPATLGISVGDDSGVKDHFGG